MLLQKAPLSYYEDGMITVLLFTGEGKAPRSYKPLIREELSQLLSFPNTTSLHIYNVTSQNYESVHALVRYVRSTSNVQIFCYIEKSLDATQLKPMCTKIIRGIL